MSRPTVHLDNHCIQSLFSNFDELHELSGWLQDVLYGAANSGHSRPSSTNALFVALRMLPVIEYNAVDRFVNTKSSTVDGRTYGRSHVYAFMSRLISAHKAICHHYHKRTGENLDEVYHINSNIVGDFCYFDGVSRSQIMQESM